MAAFFLLAALLIFPFIKAVYEGASVRIANRQPQSAIGYASDEESSALMRPICSGDPETRAHAAASLRDFATRSPAVVPSLAARLDHPDKRERLVAAYALQLLGLLARTAIPRLTRALNDQDVLVRIQAAEALARIDPTGETVLTSLIAAGCSDSHLMGITIDAVRACPNVRRRLEAYLALIRQAAAPSVRALSIHELGLLRCKAQSAIPLILESLNDKDADVRDEAYWAVFKIDPTALPADTGGSSDPAFAIFQSYGVMRVSVLAGLVVVLVVAVFVYRRRKRRPAHARRENFPPLVPMLELLIQAKRNRCNPGAGMV
jgi:HEAT repeat protein